MPDTRIEDLVNAIMESTPVRNAIDADRERMSVQTNRLYLQVTNAVSIIVETDVSPLYDVWIQNSYEGEGCTVAKSMNMARVAEFITSVFNLNYADVGPSGEGRGLQIL